MGFWCHACPAGTYNAKYGQNSERACVKCARGSYATNTGTARCNLCPFGSQTSGTGSDSPSACERSKGVVEKVSKSVSALKVNADVSIQRSDGGIQMLMMKRSHVIQMFFTAKNQLVNNVKDATNAGEEMIRRHRHD